MAAKETRPRRGRGKAAVEAGTDGQPAETSPEAAPQAPASPGETESSEPTSSPEAPVPHDDGEAPDEAERERARAAFQASEPRTAATEVSSAPHGSWWMAAGLAALLVAVALAGVWLLASGDTGRVDQQAERLDAVSDQVQNQTSRLDAAEQAISALQSEVSQMATSVSELQSTAEANRRSLEQISQSIENLSSAGDGALAGEAVGELQNTLQSLDARVANLEQGSGPDNEAVSELQNSLQSLDARVAGLEQGSDVDDLTGRIGRLEQEIVSLREQEAQRVGQAEADTALGRTYAALTQRIGAGEPFGEELEAVSAELPNAPGLQTLRPIAVEGAPTVAQLQARLEEIAAGLPEAEPEAGTAEGVGFFGTMGQRLQRMVTVRRADEADMPAALDRAREALQRNDVAAAITQIEQVSEAPPDEIATWLADARARRDVEAGLDDLSDAVLRQFAGRQ